MGTFILLFFLCVKEHFARNLLLLLRACVSNIFLSCADLMSSPSRIFSGYNRLSATRSSITSVNHNRTYPGASPNPLLIPSASSKRGGRWGLRDKGCSVGGARYTTQLSSIIPHQIFRYSSLRLDHNKIHHISPWFITGFTDAEGCFNVGLQKNPNGKFYVRPLFRIKVHSRDSLLLMRIKNYFGGIGNIYTNSKDSNYTVRSLDEILKILLHFDNYPLITKKKSDYILFKQIIQKIVEGEHLSAKGLQEIVNIRSSINLGLSDSLKTIFPNTVPVVRPEIANITIPHPEWMAGFVTGVAKGGGCFLVHMSKYGKGKLDGVSLSFKVSQHLRDELLLRSFIAFFGCGLFNYHSGKSKNGSGVFIVRKFADISEKIVPFFKEHMIEGIKREDFEDWYKVVELVRSKAHLTEDGVKKIREIKSGMNTLR